MIERLTGKQQLIKLLLAMMMLCGVYLLVAWASYSPLDNGWTTATTFSEPLNRSGAVGAWLTDFFLALFGRAAFFLPFSLTFVPFYLILHKPLPALGCSKCGAWFASFVLFLVGVCGLLTALVPNSEYYYAGGVLGIVLSQWIEPHLGQLGLLLFSMIFASVGFYFCSGQVILQLCKRLYGWIIGVPSSTQAVELSPISANEATSEQTETELPPADFEEHSAENEHDENVDSETGLTDVSAFVRPNIIGLKQEPPADTESEPLIVLPKVQLAEVEFQSSESGLQKNPPYEPLVASVDALEPTLPKVSLNPATTGEQLELPVETPEPPVAVIKPQGIFPEVAQHQEMIDQADWEAEKARETERLKAEERARQAKAANVVVHPLLQRNTKTEKPSTPLPSLDLLDKHSAGQQKITEQEIRETSARIEKELANFGVKATVEDVLVGPVVTRYEILPASGVKAAKIANLDTDLARALIFKAIRITDVVPGKPYMGIETPNQHRETVWLRDVLDSNEFRHSNAILPMALGKDISGNPIVVDMAKMPHLLVAGQTGGGKSVGVNTMILSLLFKLTPEQVRFIMIDPKVVELSIYNDIPHLLTPVVTDMKKAENALRWAVEEMERRYQLVSYVQVRNIEGYNSKIEQAEAMNLPIKNPYWKPSDSMDLTAPPLEKMSYIVLIVDEFADLMMSAGKQVEEHIMRIAQKARAVGIHLILATQRPSTDVITGVIKANIPSRIAFTVSSQIDSRTILDKGGAESLLGRGDMLYSGASSPEIIRIHGAFMSDEEVQRVADDWRARCKPEYIESIVAAREETNESSGESSGEIDPLFDEIATYVVEANVTSISGIQRRFSIGFNRAARIIDQLTEQGILSEPDSRGKREVLAR